MHIRKMSAGDIPQVAKLEQEAFAEPWSENALSDSMMLPNYTFLVAEENENILGYLGMYTVADEGNITNVAVFEEARRKGAAKALLAELLRMGREANLYGITLEVREGNMPALYLYEGIGFVRAGVRKNFYSHPQENAVIMWYYY